MVGADSLKLLEQVMGLARERGYELLDCDCTIAAQAPKLAPAPRADAQESRARAWR